MKVNNCRSRDLFFTFKKFFFFGSCLFATFLVKVKLKIRIKLHDGFYRRRVQVTERKKNRQKKEGEILNPLHEDEAGLKT